ncbi:MAG: ice-binding family protein [Methanoregula sp.]
MKRRGGILTRKRNVLFSVGGTIMLICLLTVMVIPGVLAALVDNSPVNLGSDCNFTILAKSGISTTGTSTITGNIGVSPISSAAITGFALTMDPSNTFSTSAQVSGDVFAPDYSPPTPGMLTIAVNDMESAYTDGSGRTATYTDVGAGDIGGLNLLPGVYQWSTGVNIPTDVTLSGGPDDVWIFIIPGTLDTASGTHVILSGGAQPQNVFWVVAGETTLGTNSEFNGVILDQTGIAVQTGGTVRGDLLTQTAITLDHATVTGLPACGIITPTPTPTTIPTTGPTTVLTTSTPPPVPEFPSVSVPVVLIIGILAAAFILTKKME